MRYATDIRLEQLILHILDPWDTGLVLSERTLPLDRDRRLANYLVAHIENSLRDRAAKAARFVALDDEAASGVCKALLEGSVNLVQGSRWLAERLYAVIAGNRDISAGDLAVGFYRAGNRPQVPRYLALLKINPSEEVFYHRMERDAQGDLYVDFDCRIGVMPTPMQGLRQCAFVQPLDPRPEYDMILLDRHRAVHKFFAEAFLGAELALDVQQRLVRTLRFRGDFGLRLEVEAEWCSQVIRSAERVVEPGTPPYYRIVIHSETWEE